MCVRERRVDASGLEPNASSLYGIIGGEGCAIDQVMGWVLLVVKVRLK